MKKLLLLFILMSANGLILAHPSLAQIKACLNSCDGSDACTQSCFGSNDGLLP